MVINSKVLYAHTLKQPKRRLKATGLLTVGWGFAACAGGSVQVDQVRP